MKRGRRVVGVVGVVMFGVVGEMVLKVGSFELGL